MWDDMFFDNHDLGHSGALPYAIAGVDIALWVSFAKTQSSLYFQYLR
jgi:hypothetical protein